MSQQQKEGLNAMYKSTIVVLFSICSYFLYGMSEKVERSSETTIRIEERIKLLDYRIQAVELQVKLGQVTNP